MSTPEINYTVKELLARMEGKIDFLLSGLTGKADKSDVEAIVLRMTADQTATNLRVTALETNVAADGAVNTYKRWLVATAFLAVASICTIVGMVLSA